MLVAHGSHTEWVWCLFMVQSGQQEIDNALTMINRVACETRYGDNDLPANRRVGNGVTVGANLKFFDVERHPVLRVEQLRFAATQAVKTKTLTMANITAGAQLAINDRLRCWRRWTSSRITP